MNRELPQFQAGTAMLIENSHLLQQIGYDEAAGGSELVGSAYQLGLIESSAEVSIGHLSRGLKAIGLLIRSHDNTIGDEAEILYGLAGLLQETGDTICALQNAVQMAGDGYRVAQAREAKQQSKHKEANS
ncbi:hypothetical protein [Chromobacterium violaceum]|uniref:Uncharacterized protein n=1 Tax=Chromobacterium violaceum (strain ATCC 12472 / DSM 30191 / JCM 1249 / CCUG 213 / NBRC 12614 / NCIMB 9131 / NCTC 9757 / MK) TaxID=243365 RepID=Q7NRC8_CHRVO|nr:hypothetical protein [Chromobacterium violaceum]AAQ61517.1 hypothetical protein CV_3855 [Chromobacterium violaceum ATCC 12472]SUX88558.1 Uncharacterised protein [Chromobacterium violaceum]